MEEQDSAARPGTKAKDFGKLKHGCEHYRRRCKIRAPCCNQLFPCRHCHNEAASSLSNPNDLHELVRQDVKQVARVCSNCGVNMGEYFCDTCKFYDDETEKGQFHCQQCGICRVGGRDNFFHCKKCGSCYPVDILDNHSCVENSMKNFCPVCYEYLFDSIKATKILKCGHTMHMDCFDDMKNRIYEEIEATAMPEEYRYKVSILCNDCNNNGEACFHILGHKCGHCNSYNTRRISAPDN